MKQPMRTFEGHDQALYASAAAIAVRVFAGAVVDQRNGGRVSVAGDAM